MDSLVAGGTFDGTSLMALIPPNSATCGRADISAGQLLGLWQEYYRLFDNHAGRVVGSSWTGEVGGTCVPRVDGVVCSSGASGFRFGQQLFVESGGSSDGVGQGDAGSGGRLAEVLSGRDRGGSSESVCGGFGAQGRVSLGTDAKCAVARGSGTSEKSEVLSGLGGGVCREFVASEQEKNLGVDVGVACASVVESFPAGLPALEVSEKTLRNRERRREHKERKERKKKLQSAGVRSRYVSAVEGSVPEWRRKRGDMDVGGKSVLECKPGFFSESSDEQRRLLRESRASMLAAQNELNTFRAKQQLELEKAKNIDQLKKRQETQIMRQTEVNKVQVEKAFASLARAGNVPGVVGCAETVVSGSGSGVSPVFSGVGSGSVSPNSSVSLAEIHALQKEHLSQKKDIEEMKRQLNHLKFLDPEMYKKIGGGFERAPTVNTGYTVDSQGQPIGEPPDTHWGGEIQADGKYHYVTDEPFHLYDC